MTKTTLHTILLLGLSCLLAACSSNVIFEESQPAGAKLEQRIPKKLQGKYKKVGENDPIVIDENAMIAYPVDSMGKGDTLFAFTDSVFVTHYKKYWYVNKQTSEGKWLVYPVTQRNDTLVVYNGTEGYEGIEKESFVRMVRTFDPVDSTESVTYYAKPTKKQLLLLHEKEVFGYEEKYVRIE